jgi:hypothetical protein
MPYIVLTEDQARIIQQAGGPVELRDSQGRPIACGTALPREDAEMITRSRESQAAAGMRVPSEQVQAHLRKLEEIAGREELDETRALELLRRMRAGEDV